MGKIQRGKDREGEDQTVAVYVTWQQEQFWWNIFRKQNGIPQVTV